MSSDIKSAEVTVIIPAYRAAATLGRALDSVAAQTAPPGKVVVVDDGSDDGTAEAAQGHAGRFPDGVLTVIRQSNQGAGAARNRGIVEAKTEWLAFLDADDAWRPEKLARTLAVLGGTGGVMASHDMVVHGLDGAETVVDCTRHFTREADPFLSLYLRGYVATSTVVVRREAVVAAGGFDPSLGAAQDYDLWLAVYERHGAAATVFPEPLTDYFVTANSITANAERRRRCGLQVIANHGAAVKARLGWAGAVKRVLLKTAIIHYEAFGMLRAQGRTNAALAVLVKGLGAMVGALLAPPLAPRPRGSHLETPGPGRQR